MRTKWMLIALSVSALLLCRTAAATGILIPEKQDLPPLEIRSHRVHAEIEGGVATTRVKEVFRNNTDRQLEATFVFPVPRDAALTDFAMFVDGRRQSGEIVPAGRARRIYQQIVRRLRDPGLLEFMDSGLLRMKVFPVQPRKPLQVEVSYTHQLPFDAGVYEYSFPLKIGHNASRVTGDFTVTVDISSRQPIKSVYSPTHRLGVTRRDDHSAVAGFERMGAALDSDFALFYTVGKKDFGLNLLTHRMKGEDGFFALMIAPRVELAQEQIMNKDVCFVIDVSGSMRRQKRIAGARDAVKFCLQSLRPSDRFSVISFSNTVQTWAAGLQEAAPEAVGKAVRWVEGLEAEGGTDLCGAVTTALNAGPEGPRPYLIVLVTDGEPTVGVTETEQIVARIRDSNRSNVRVFPFGIAENLDVPLLDRIAEATRGYSEYLAPGREMEAKISSFFRKVSHPVMSELELKFGDIRVRDVYPPSLPDLFRGSQVVAFGRYAGSGSVAVRLKGTMQDREEEFVYDASFPPAAPANDFLPKLWARRKIGYMLDQIRLHGEKDELVTEVQRLSEEYGIATPYTSYLVLDSEEAYRRHGLVRGQDLDHLRSAGVALKSRGGGEGVRNKARVRALREQKAYLGAPAADASADASRAIKLSEELRDWKEEGVLDGAEEAAPVRRVDGRRFLRLGESWVDAAFEKGMDMLRVEWGSDAYFAVLEAFPGLRKPLSLGRSVVVVIGQKALVVTDDGNREMGAGEIERFFQG